MTDPRAVRVRFAPSPTGMFHVGGARSALHNWAVAHRMGGTFVLRIEDTDEARSRPEWTVGIIDALAWIGISADDPAFEGPLLQSAAAGSHVDSAQRLYQQGHAYYCDLTPAQVQARADASGVPGYDGYSRDRGLGPGAGRVLRFRVPDGVTVVDDLVRGRVEFDNSSLEDFVLVRSDGSPVFVLANAVDDIGMGITHVIRGEEHLPNTPKQQLIWSALGHAPPVWAHVPVLVNESRKKLSKRRDKVSLDQYRQEGYLPEAMVNYLMTLGWTSPGAEEAGTEIMSWPDMEAVFDLADVNSSPAFFDVRKLDAFNAEYIRAMDVDQFVERASEEIPDDWDRDRFAQIAPVLQERTVRFDDDIPDKVDFLFLPDGADVEIDDASWVKATKAEWAEPLYDDVYDAYEGLPDDRWQTDELKSEYERVMERYGIKLGKAQAPVRVAITGRAVGPPLFESLEVLGRHETLRRLDAARPRFGSG
ncbi:MAG: glutamate--tRNA ligase [Actinomycetota bacterium]